MCFGGLLGLRHKQLKTSFLARNLYVNNDHRHSPEDTRQNQCWFNVGPPSCHF